jgi:hypothetical protein
MFSLGHHLLRLLSRYQKNNKATKAAAIDTPIPGHISLRRQGGSRGIQPAPRLMFWPIIFVSIQNEVKHQHDTPFQDRNQVAPIAFDK